MIMIIHVSDAVGPTVVMRWVLSLLCFGAANAVHHDIHDKVAHFSSLAQVAKRRKYSLIPVQVE